MAHHGGRSADMSGIGRPAFAPAVSEPLDHWTDDELRAAVLAYRAMYERERAGKHVVKSEVIRGLCSGPLGRRSPGSVSRRMNNISAVLDEAGMERMRGYAPLRHVGVNVRQRLMHIIEEAWGDAAPWDVTLPVAPVRVVPVGAIKQEAYAMAGIPPRVARRVEQALVQRYTDASATHGRRVVSHVYVGGLQSDAFDETLNVLIEAKADARREFARMALGQLLDYRRYEPSDPRLAVLMPSRPTSATCDFLLQNGVEVVWEREPGRFGDTLGGHLS